MNAQPIVDERAFQHFDRCRSQDLEAKPFRRDVLQVCGVGKEAEHLLTRFVNPQTVFEKERNHPWKFTMKV